MIDRGAVVRGFFALFAIAAVLAGAYGLFSDTDGTSGNFLEDDRADGTSYAYGPIFDDPDGYRSQTLADPFVRRMKVTGGTFGSTITRQVRIDIDGTGPIPTREVTLQTQPAVELFSGPRRERAVDVLHGIQRILEERGGLVEGVSLASTKGGVEAAAISGIIETYPTTGVRSAADQQFVVAVLDVIAKQLSEGAFAWYDQRFQQVVFGPVISRGLLKWIRTPKQTSPAENLFTAYVVRHELEHAVTPRGAANFHLTWLEEGTADVIAKWPGAAAETARELGMTYPEEFDDKPYETTRGGYPQYTSAVRILLTGAGVDTSRPGQLDEASQLLQEHELEDVPAALAERMAERNRLSADEQARIEREIGAVDGSPAAARRIVARL